MSGARTSAYVIGREDLNARWILLYVVTWLLQCISAVARYFVLYGIIWVPDKIEYLNLPVKHLAIVIAAAPLLISLATLVWPWGGWLWEQQEGARTPSEREQTVFDFAFAELAEKDPRPLRPPHRWCVLDESDPNGCVYAITLMLTRGLLDSPFGPAVLGHEMRHLNSGDGRLLAALYRILCWPRNPTRPAFKPLALVLNGHAAMLPVKAAWSMYFRAREMNADNYVKELGLGPTLAAYLETYALEGDRPTRFKMFGDSSHPWTEHRIENLLAP